MREKDLLINSILYFFGSLGKGVASIIVIFIASFYIEPSSLGTYDLITSTLTLLQPMIIFQINDGVYRWLLEYPNNSKEIISTGFKITYRNLIITNIIIIIGISFLDFQYKILIILLLNINCIYPLLIQITRGLKNHKIFAISGIISAIIVLSTSFILLHFFQFGINGIYIAQILSSLFGIIYLALKQNISFIIDSSSKDKYRKKMQRYSIMLVPNSINQWIMKALDKYCILFFLSTYDNGIYTIAHRFPDIFIMLNSMFYSAWVEQSISEYSSVDRDEYFSKIYNIYSNVLISIVLLVIPITKYIIYIFVGSSYKSAFIYVPFLYISVIFSGLSGFIGTGYLGTKKTEGIMWTSLAGSFTNTLINVILMPYFGLQIAGISSVCAYFVMWFIRLKQTNKFFNIIIEWKKFIPMILLTFIYAILVQLDNTYLDFILLVCAIILSVITNFYFIKNIINFIYRIFIKYKK